MSADISLLEQLRQTPGYVERSWHMTGEDAWDPRLPVGPGILPSLETTSRDLLGPEASLENVMQQAQERLVPYRQTTDTLAVNRIIIGSASADIGAYDAERLFYAQHGCSIGIDPAIAAREVNFAKAGDLIVGRSDPYRDVARAKRAVDAASVNGNHGDVISMVDLGVQADSMYYTSHALLDLALQYQQDQDESNPVHHILQRLREQPESLVRLYTLDAPMQIFLLWLANQSGLNTVNVESNSPEAAERWNHKGILYPTLEDAEAVDLSGVNPEDVDEIMAREAAYSQIEQELGVQIPRMPGYTINKNTDTEDQYVARVMRAAGLMQERYGITTLCLKHTKSSDGAGVNHSLRVDQEDPRYDLATHAREAFAAGQDLVLEPHLTYERVAIGDRSYDASISGHISNGRSRQGLTLMFIEGKEWRGNTGITAQNCEEIIRPEHYKLIQSTMDRLAGSIQRLEEAGRKVGLRKGGIDFGIGTIGGKFGDRVLVVAQDPNLRTTGAESLHASIDTNPQKLPASTRVIKPALQASYTDVQGLVATYGAGVIALVQPGWGMIVAHDESPRAAAEKVLEIEGLLREQGMVI